MFSICLYYETSYSNQMYQNPANGMAQGQQQQQQQQLQSNPYTQPQSNPYTQPQTENPTTQ